jgi:hypothetical protein
LAPAHDAPGGVFFHVYAGLPPLDPVALLDQQLRDASAFLRAEFEEVPFDIALVGGGSLAAGRQTHEEDAQDGDAIRLQLRLRYALISGQSYTMLLSHSAR